MPPSNNRIFVPVAVWHTPRGDVELQREIVLAGLTDFIGFFPTTRRAFIGRQA